MSNHEGALLRRGYIKASEIHDGEPVPIMVRVALPEATIASG